MCRFLFDQRQVDGERRALSFDAVNCDVAIVLANDAVDLGQTQPGTPTRPLRGVEGLEYVLHHLFGHTMTLVVNVAAVVSFHLMAPEARKNMALQAEKDLVFDAALEALSKRRMTNSARLADQLSGDLYSQLVDDLFGDQDRAPTPPPHPTPNARQRLSTHTLSIHANGHHDEEEEDDVPL